MEIDLNAESVNRIKTENIPEPGIHLKNVAREKNRRAAWQNEMIRISVLDSDGNERMGCTWRIPRNKLTTAFLQEIINRSPAKEDPDGCAIEFLRDSAGVDVIWPEQMQQECNPKPFSYYVVKKFVTEGYDALDDKHYSGDLRILLQNVPLKTSNELYSVRMEDVRAWVMFGVVEEDAYVQKYVKKVAHLKKALELMDARIKMQATNKLFDDRAKEIVGGKADLERMDRYLELSREKETIEAEHDHAQQEVEKTMQQRLGSMLTVRQGRVDMVSDRCTWIVEFGGINKDKVGVVTVAVAVAESQITYSLTHPPLLSSKTWLLTKQTGPESASRSAPKMASSSRTLAAVSSRTARSPTFLTSPSFS